MNVIFHSLKLLEIIILSLHHAEPEMVLIRFFTPPYRKADVEVQREPPILAKIYQRGTVVSQLRPEVKLGLYSKNN